MDVQTYPQNHHWDQQQPAANGKERNNFGAGGFTSDEDDDFDDGNNAAKLYERTRIRALADEREAVQKKTFTKWINSHLSKYSTSIEELYVDLRDGKVLLKLLELLSGEQLPKPTRGRMRIHCLENVDKSLNFLIEQHVHLENMGAHDIVDGNARLTLGLIWTIILRFQIQDIIYEQEEGADMVTRSAKDALLLWCQMKTAGYPNCNVRNFATSWRDGLPFAAIIHKHRPDLLDYNTLTKNTPEQNIEKAFSIAQSLGIPRLMDISDVKAEIPDEKSIITQVAEYYHYFNKAKADNVNTKRIGKVLNEALEQERLIHQYERMVSDLLEWIQKTIKILDDRQFANTLIGVQQHLAAFNTYRTVEKPPKFSEKGNLEILLFTIQSKLRANNQRDYQPPDGKYIYDVNREWERLEKAEHARELALREALIRQEKLEQLAGRFYHKAALREEWLTENQRLVSQDSFGDDLPAVEAALKKHEAIVADINSYEERVKAVSHVAQNLYDENYHDVGRILERRDNVIVLWQALLDLLKARRLRMDLCLKCQQVFQEMSYLLDWIDEIKNRLLSEDYGKHLMGVEDLLQKHDLIEADIRVLGGRIQKTADQANYFIACDQFPAEIGAYRPVDPSLVKSRGENLDFAYRQLQELSKQRRQALDQSREMWQFFWDMADEEQWIKEKGQLMSSPDLGHDINSVERLLRKHKASEEELHAHQTLVKQSKRRGEDLIAAQNIGSTQIRQRILEMDQLWDELIDITSERKKKLLESQEFFQFLADCEDGESWLAEQQRHVASQDMGNKLAVTESYIKRNQEIVEALRQFKDTTKQLDETGDRISDYPEVDGPKVTRRLEQLHKRYEEVLETALHRHERLTNALSMYKVYSVSDTVHTWITEKEKLLTTLAPTDEVEELAVLRTRFEYFEKEMALNAEKVSQVNALSQKLVEERDKSVPSDQTDASKDVAKHRADLNKSWSDLAGVVDRKRDELRLAILLQDFIINCHETQNWIKEKARLVESTDQLGNDLDDIMQLQRRLGGLQRDMVVLQAKIDDLDGKADELIRHRPQDKAQVEAERAAVKQLWLELNEMLKERDDRLSDSSDLQRFLQDLDHFQMWLSRTQSAVAGQDIPSGLDETEKQRVEHKGILDEINSYVPEFTRLMEFGNKVTRDQTDPQYVFLRQRLNGLGDSWETLGKMAKERTRHLEECLWAQCFFRDALQVDVILSKQEVFLTKEDFPSTLEAAQEAIKQHENFVASMKANDDKIDKVLAVGDQHVNNQIINHQRIKTKCEQIVARRNSLKIKANDRLKQLRKAILLQEFNQEVDDVEEWIAEKILVASEDSPRDAKNLAARYSKFKAFEEELLVNTDKIDRVIKDGEHISYEHPDLRKQIDPRIDDLRRQWSELNDIAKDKSAKMAESNREKLFDQQVQSVSAWVSEISEQIITEEDETEEVLSLIDLNRREADILKKNKDLMEKKKQLDDIQSHAAKLQEQFPERKEEFERVQLEVKTKITQLEAPLLRRKSKIHVRRKIGQLMRDIDDEKDWVLEKLRIVRSPDVGGNLLSVQHLLRRHRLLHTEVDNHRPQIDRISAEVDELVDEQHPKAAEFSGARDELMRLWDELTAAIQNRQRQLQANELVQQYLSDAAEAKQWMGEQEVYLMGDERAKDEQGAENAIKKHEQLQASVEHFGGEIRSLGDRATEIQATDPALINEANKATVANRQSGVDKQYAGLRDLCLERRSRLQEVLKLFNLLREIMDLEAWIADRTVVASSHDMGADYEHCCLLRERFAEFTRDTTDVGKQRVAAANVYCDTLISQGHTDSADIAEWKDRINEAWADVLELMETRTQLLKSAWDLHKFLCDCQDVLDVLAEKSHTLLDDDEVGKDGKSVTALQRKHAAFEYELTRLSQQVEAVVEAANNLLPCYSGDKEHAIADRKDEVLNAWRNLQQTTEHRKHYLMDTADLHRFFAMVRELRIWMDGMRGEIASKEKPRDVSGVELLMNTHKSFQAELDARAESFSICLSLGRTLLNRGHPRQAEVREKCITLVTERQQLLDQWADRWEQLCLMLEVFQFARDAAVAEAWLISQEPYLANRNLGENLDETLSLLKKHEAFQKAVALQEERFIGLRKLTTFELREREKTPETEAARRRERERRIQEAIREFQPPPPVSGQSATTTAAGVDSRSQQPGRAGPSTPQRSGSGAIPGAAGVTQLDSVDPSQAASTAASPASRTLPTTDRGGVAHRPAGTLPGQTVGISKPPPVPKQDMEGMLFRKHEWAEGGKKAGSRAWHELYLVLSLEQCSISAYKDQRHAKERPQERYHGEAAVPLDGATAAPASNYNKRAHVFRLKLPQGAEYLFQAHSDNEMHDWVRSINSTARGSRRTSTVSGDSAGQTGAAGSYSTGQRSTPGPSGTKYSTLPASSAGATGTGGSGQPGSSQAFTPPGSGSVTPGLQASGGVPQSATSTGSKKKIFTLGRSKK